MITQPADLIKKVPRTNKHIRKGLGLPLVKTKKADMVGHKSRAVPIGLSALINLKKAESFSLFTI